MGRALRTLLSNISFHKEQTGKKKRTGKWRTRGHRWMLLLYIFDLH